MPYLDLTLSRDPTPELRDRIAGALTELTAGVLGKRRDLIALSIRIVPVSHWYVGGSSLADRDLASFHLDVQVTEGTNTKREKAAYVASVFEAMTGLLGPLVPASYVVIDELRADAWGYAGRTQEDRYIRDGGQSNAAIASGDLALEHQQTQRALGVVVGGQHPGLAQEGPQRGPIPQQIGAGRDGAPARRLLGSQSATGMDGASEGV